MRLFPVLVFLVATDTSGEWPIIKCWLLSNKLKKNFAEKAESKISRATHKECKLQRNADRRDWKACCQLTLHLVWAYGYLRCTGTSFSSRVFHQLVGFSTKSAQIKSWKFKWANSLRASSPIWASEASLARTRERGAEGGLRRSLTRSRETRSIRPNRRACSQAICSFKFSTSKLEFYIWIQYFTLFF